MKFKPKLTREETLQQKDKRRDKGKKRMVSWFNPPFSIQVDENYLVRRHFVNALDRYFPKGHKLHSLLNRTTVKMSYRTMLNFAKIVIGQNHRMMEEFGKDNLRLRKLRNK